MIFESFETNLLILFLLSLFESYESNSRFCVSRADVAVQIINNLYHNFPDQRIVIVTHSNQALNQIFEKVRRQTPQHNSHLQNSFLELTISFR